MPPGAAGPAREFQVTVVCLLTIETVSDFMAAGDRQRRTGYVEKATGNIAGRGYDKPDGGSCSSGGFCRACDSSDDGRPSENEA
jgi:hypothetical protein